MPTLQSEQTREAWLQEAIHFLSGKFFDTPVRSLPQKLAVSCGIPKGSNEAIGQCWDPKVASDGTTHIFVCPSVDDPYTVLSILLHELCHAVIGVHQGHNSEFGRIARSVGLRGPLTSTHVPKDTDCGRVLLEAMEVLGDYPHKALNKRPKKKKNNSPKRVKLVSTENTEYKLSISLDLLEKHGLPTDPWGKEMEVDS